MRTLLQFDDFAEDAMKVREVVISGKFETEIGPDGGKYTGISQYPVPSWFDRISCAVGKEIIPRISCFRLNLAGEMPHSFVHSDGICSQWASILYLNTPQQCYGGTAFWRHTGLNINRMPTPDELTKLGLKVDWFHSMMEREWKDLTFWEQAGFVEMRWNRFITYPTSMFHSRYPFEGFGNKPENGRLVWVCFYDI